RRRAVASAPQPERRRMSALSVAIGKRLRAERREFVLDVSFDSDADVTVLLGPSGAGKTLTLQAIAGLLRPDRGLIRLGEHVLFDAAARIELPARERNVGLVFQDYALFPHLTVVQNVAFAGSHGWRNPRMAGDAAAALLAPFELEPFAGSYPAELSGGQ